MQKRRESVVCWVITDFIFVQSCQMWVEKHGIIHENWDTQIRVDTNSFIVFISMYLAKCEVLSAYTNLTR